MDWGRRYISQVRGACLTLDSGNVVADALAVSLDMPLEWAIGFLFGNTELSLELWNIIAGILGFDD